MKNIICIIIAVSALAQAIRSDSANAKLPTHSEKSNFFFVLGSSYVGTVEGRESKVSISLKTVIDPDTTFSFYTVEFNLFSVEGSTRTESSQELMYDDIVSLVEATKRLESMNKSLSKLDTFEAIYTAGANLKFTRYSVPGGGMKCAVKCGDMTTILESFEKLRALLETAKKKFDEIIKADQKGTGE